MLQLIREVLLTIRYSSSPKSQSAEDYLLGFSHCAHYVAGHISRAQYETIRLLAGNAAKHNLEDLMRKSA